MVAREAELAQLHELWTQARQGTRQVVFVTGEAGIGKATLVDAFVAQVVATEAVWFGRGQCIEQYGAGEAYLPLLEALGQLGRGPEGSRLVELLRQQAPSWLLQMPALLPATEYAALHQRSTGTTRERMLRELAEAVETLSRAHPLLLVLEDLHWSDYATMDWLALVARRRVDTRLLVLGTYRPADAVARAHPVHSLTQELQRHGQCTELLLPYLPEAGVATYLAQRFDAAHFPAAIAHILHQRTSGNAFFLVTVVEELVRQGLLAPQGGGWTSRGSLEAVAACIPDSIRHLIEHQLAQITTPAQEILAAASVAGTEFVAAAVAASLGQATEDVEICCDTLARHGQFLQAWGSAEWPDGTVAARYRFIHDLYREVLYERVPVSRRVQWHQRIGVRLEAGYGATARELAAELAMHFERGRDVTRAVQYRQYAGEQALRRSAHQEAIAHLTAGLTQLHQLQDSPLRAQQELAVQSALGAALRATRAYAPETEHAYLRARELCQQFGEPPQLFPVLYSLYELYEYRGAFQHSQALGEQLLHLAHRRHDTTLLLGAYDSLACTAFHLGAFARVLEHTEPGLSLYDPQQHRAMASLYGKDLRVSCHYWSAMALWFLGYPDRALGRINEALTLAQELAHPYSIAVALNRAAVLGQFRQESHATRQWTEAAVGIATEHGFPRHAAIGPLLRGWALARQGQGAEGIAQIQQGFAAYRELGMAMEDPYFLALLAEAYASVDQVEDGLAALANALALLPSGRGFFYEAEIYRLQGALSLRLPTPDVQQVEACFSRALAIARRHKPRSAVAAAGQARCRQAAARGGLWLVYGRI
jgi:predicted ATPase